MIRIPEFLKIIQPKRVLLRREGDVEQNRFTYELFKIPRPMMVFLKRQSDFDRNRNTYRCFITRLGEKEAENLNKIHYGGIDDLIEQIKCGKIENSEPLTWQIFDESTGQFYDCEELTEVQKVISAHRYLQLNGSRATSFDWQPGMGYNMVEA